MLKSIHGYNVAEGNQKRKRNDEWMKSINRMLSTTRNCTITGHAYHQHLSNHKNLFD
jgi:hypothetical protein